MSSLILSFQFFLNDDQFELILIKFFFNDIAFVAVAVGPYTIFTEQPAGVDFLCYTSLISFRKQLNCRC